MNSETSPDASSTSTECEDLERRFFWLRVLFEHRVPTGVLANLLADIQQRMDVVSSGAGGRRVMPGDACPASRELRALGALCDRLAALFVRPTDDQRVQ